MKNEYKFAKKACTHNNLLINIIRFRVTYYVCVPALYKQPLCWSKITDGSNKFNNTCILLKKSYRYIMLYDLTLNAQIQI